MITSISDAWHLHRRPLLVGGGLLAATALLLFAVGFVVHTSGGGTRGHRVRPMAKPPVTSTATSSHGPVIADAAAWDAIPAVLPATSAQYPAIPSAAHTDPGAYTAAFVQELFTRSFADARTDLLAWAQYEDAPLGDATFPRADWSKVLVDSLIDPTWDQAIDTPAQAEGPWAALAHEHATWQAGRVTTRVDPQWEQKVADGYQSADPLTSLWDASLTITQHAAGEPTRTFDVAITTQLGTSPRGGYGAAATNSFAIREVK